MTDNDKSLMKQMMHAGRYNGVYDLMPEYNLEKSRAIIKDMGNKWCCHPDNHIKRLDVPLPILNEPKTKVLKKK